MARKLKNVLPVIVLSQFLCTSLWFAGNAVISDIIVEFSLSIELLGHLVSAIQFGFISGTLLFALLTISDRFSPSIVFCVCAVLAALANLSMLLAESAALLLLSRFFTGVCLAGIYPVGMKIASDHHQKGLGKALGFLVGALVLGTAFPHLLRSFTIALQWQYVIGATSILSVIGGLLIYLLVPDGPYRNYGARFDASALFKVFRKKDFRQAALGYFGHMWELYTFWAFVPFVLSSYNHINPDLKLPVPALSFSIIAIGALGCVAGGYIAQQWGSYRLAFSALFLSGLCCLLSVFMFKMAPLVLIIFLLAWGMFVTADSPQFSTLVAQSAPAESKGTALTIVNSIGFAITIVSIQFINAIMELVSPQFLFLFLVAGPVAGLAGMYRVAPKHQPVN